MKKLWRPLLIMMIDVVSVCVSAGVALLVRFDFTGGEIPARYLQSAYYYVLIQVVIMFCVFWWQRMYHFIWRTVNAVDVAQMCASVLLSYALGFLVCNFLEVDLPRSVWFMILVFQLILLVGERCSIRFIGVFRSMFAHRNSGGPRVMLIGAGQAGQILARELRASKKINGHLCCVIDDNPQLHGKYIDGVCIVGGRSCIQDAVKQYQINQIIFAIPTAKEEDRKEILNLCNQTGCHLRVLPGIYQLLNGEVSMAAVKDVQVEDLLGRTPVKLDTNAVSQFLRDKVVIVTGGGGSIGSELCRQIAKYHPRRLIILDIYENNAYDIQQELKRIYGIHLNLSVEIASVRDKKRIYQIFRDTAPDVVFHAAAHKHVPLMEDCPAEAIKNNIFGTYHVVRAAEKFGAKKFVMISTDKAVNPTNLMGATKRFCEMILQSRRDSSTEYCAVRFGNVLGSNGSVVPLFKQQIESGGPVTITDKRIIRYFMTIPEAAMLVLEAGAMARQSQIFVLDMGEPVKILTLAENLIRLSGLKPYEDIAIEEVGLRPGEKLYEELLMRSENLMETPNRKIFVEQQRFIPQTEIMNGLIALDQCVTEDRPKDEVIALMKRLVPTYRDPEEVNRVARESIYCNEE